MTPFAKRNVTPIPEDLLSTVPLPVDNNITVKGSSPDVERDTMPLIVKKAKRTAWQTKKLAGKLKASSLLQTLKNDCGFILKYIRYQQDDPEHEQVRSPRRLVYDRQGDCDCFAVFLATLLINQGIAFRFRLAQYANSGGEWTHIYIVVPKNQSFKGSLSDRSQYYVLDAVTNQFNYEVPFTKKRDVTMTLQFLDGFAPRSIATLGACTTEQNLTAFNLRKYVDTEVVVQAGMVPTEQFLNQKNYLYEYHLDQASNSGYFVVFSPKGSINVATIITKEQAAQLESMMETVSAPPAAAGTTAASASQPSAEKSSSNWFGYMLTGIGILSSMRNAGGGASLSGLTKSKAPFKKTAIKKPIASKIHTPAKHPVINI